MPFRNVVPSLNSKWGTIFSVYLHPFLTCIFFFYLKPCGWYNFDPLNIGNLSILLGNINVKQMGGLNYYNLKFQETKIELTPYLNDKMQFNIPFGYCYPIHNLSIRGQIPIPFHFIRFRSQYSHLPIEEQVVVQLLLIPRVYKRKGNACILGKIFLHSEYQLIGF